MIPIIFINILTLRLFFGSILEKTLKVRLRWYRWSFLPSLKASPFETRSSFRTHGIDGVVHLRSLIWNRRGQPGNKMYDAAPAVSMSTEYPAVGNTGSWNVSSSVRFGPNPFWTRAINMLGTCSARHQSSYTMSFRNIGVNSEYLLVFSGIE